MADQEAPRNRKERRAAARESGKPVAAPTSTLKVKMELPDRAGPKAKTLLDLYEEKKALLDQGNPFDPKHEDGLIRDEGGNILEAGLGDGEPIGPVGQAFFWAVTLAMLHFTLDVLVYNQYAIEVLWPAIFKRTFKILPILFLLVFLLRSEIASRFSSIRQVFYLAVAAGAGCYTIHITNRYGYIAVMKQAPPLGTLWVWSVIEMDIAFAVNCFPLIPPDEPKDKTPGANKSKVSPAAAPAEQEATQEIGEQKLAGGEGDGLNGESGAAAAKAKAGNGKGVGEGSSKEAEDGGSKKGEDGIRDCDWVVFG
ncbi:hypothetical protein LTR65_002409 [Meristemomyces frigidus]